MSSGRISPGSSCDHCILSRSDLVHGESLQSVPPAMHDIAMGLAYRGASAHELAHYMTHWAIVAAERAIAWAAVEDARQARDNADAQWDTDHGTEYEDPES